MQKKQQYSHSHVEGDRLLNKIRAHRITRFQEIEGDLLIFFRTVDALFVKNQGKTAGANRSTKTWYANEALQLLLENLTGKTIETRIMLKGLAFSKHDVDLAYRQDQMGQKRPVSVGEVKIAGTPSHKGNKKTSGPKGRPLNQDIDKRAREMVCTSTDLKRQWRRGGTPSLATRNDPFYGGFYLGRAADDNDAKLVTQKLCALHAVGAYVDAVGLFFFKDGGNDRYVATKPTRGYTMDDALAAFARRVKES